MSSMVAGPAPPSAVVQRAWVAVVAFGGKLAEALPGNANVSRGANVAVVAVCSNKCRRVVNTSEVCARIFGA